MKANVRITRSQALMYSILALLVEESMRSDNPFATTFHEQAASFNRYCSDDKKKDLFDLEQTKEEARAKWTESLTLAIRTRATLHLPSQKLPLYLEAELRMFRTGQESPWQFHYCKWIGPKNEPTMEYKVLAKPFADEEEAKRFQQPMLFEGVGSAKKLIVADKAMLSAISTQLKRQLGVE